MELDLLYQDVLRDHHKNPRGFGPLAGAERSQEGFNPLCGDRVVVQLNLSPDQSQIAQIQFEGEGCSICLASASMLIEETEGQPVSKVLNAIEDFRGLMQGTKPDEYFEGDLRALAGVKRFPVRIKCALLPWMTLKSLLSPSFGKQPVNTEVQ